MEISNPSLAISLPLLTSLNVRINKTLINQKSIKLFAVLSCPVERIQPWECCFYQIGSAGTLQGWVWSHRDNCSSCWRSECISLYFYLHIDLFLCPLIFLLCRDTDQKISLESVHFCYLFCLLINVWFCSSFLIWSSQWIRIEWPCFHSDNLLGKHLFSYWFFFLLSTSYLLDFRSFFLLVIPLQLIAHFSFPRVCHPSVTNSSN